MTADGFRIDKWLWVARFAKSRGKARSLCLSGMIRTGGTRIEKPGREVHPGDILTLPKGNQILVIRILNNSERRVSARDVTQLYEIVPDSPE